MGAIFLKLLNMSITAGWLILAILCVRLLFRKMPKWMNCLLWGVVAVRLLIPFSIESIYSLQPSAEPIQSHTVVEGDIVPYVPSIESNFTVVENTVNPILADTFAYEATESVAPLQVFTEVAGYIWLGGMLVLLCFAVGSVIRLRLSVRESIRYKEKVFICDAVKSPFILGVIRPRIYLSSSLGEDEMKHILAHENAHLRRKDHLWKPFGYLLLSVYWFHPLCWIAYILLCKDIELACDEKVIKDMGFDDKKGYSRVLLSCATQRRLVSVCPLAFGEVGVKERVKSVLNYKRPAFWITMIAIVAGIVVAVCFLTNPAREYRIRITIPAGSTEEIIYQEDFFYSDEEISPKGKKIILSLSEGMGDTEVVLKPIEVKEENAYEPTYITPGMPVKMDVEKGAWFKIGVNMQNPTTEDMDVYVMVRNVEVRIADHEPVEELEKQLPEEKPDEPMEEKENVGSQKAPEWITEEINVEKRDVTHDGVADYIVTSMTYEPAYMDANASLLDRIEKHIRFDLVQVNVYEGQELSDTYRDENLLWSHDFSSVHVANGQLSIVQWKGQDYLLMSNLWGGQGTAGWDYEVFSFNASGEKHVLDNKSIQFEMGEGSSAEGYEEFQHSLERYIPNGTLIVACDIDMERQLVRTEGTSYTSQDYYWGAFLKYDDMGGDMDQEYNGFPVNTLPNVTMNMEKYKSWEGELLINNDTDSELATGEWYCIQKKVDGAWYRMDERTDGIWEEVEYPVPDGKTTVLQTNWKAWYGELPAGKYRIVKEIYTSSSDRSAPQYVAAEFEVLVSN